MDPNRPDRILHEWTAVARTARRPATSPRRAVLRSALPGASMAGALVAVAAVLVAVVWLGSPRPNGGVGVIPSATPTPGATATAAPPSMTATTAVPSTSPAATPAATASPTVGACDIPVLSARITAWEGAAGHRIATVTMTNTAPARCTIPASWRPQLTDGAGSILLDGAPATTSGPVTLPSGRSLSTLVDTSNYCGVAPTAPVTIAFVREDGGRVVAAPLGPTDATVPPCLGSPGSAGMIQMHAWGS